MRCTRALDICAGDRRRCGVDVHSIRIPYYYPAPQSREIEIIRTIEPTRKTSEDFVTRMTSEPLDEQRRVMGERVVAV